MITPPHKYLRHSNLESLRIVSMLLVLLIHYLPSRLTPTPETIESDFWQICLNLELRSLSFVCVNCFILISGYFGIKWRFKSLCGLLYQIIFYSGVAWIIGYAMLGAGYDAYIDIWGNHLSKAFSVRWFIAAYLLLYLFSPVINSFVENSSKKQLSQFLIVFYIVSTVYGYFMLLDEFNAGMSFISLIGIYMTGAYLRKYKDKIFAYSASKDFLIYIGIGFFLTISSIVILKLGIRKSIYGYLNPLIIIDAIYLFLCFSKLEVGISKPINLVAASAFSVYCLHHHPYIGGLYDHIGTIINTNQHFSLLFAVMYFIAIYLLCFILDPIRKFSFNILADLFYKTSNVVKPFVKK